MEERKRNVPGIKLLKCSKLPSEIKHWKAVILIRKLQQALPIFSYSDVKRNGRVIGVRGYCQEGKLSMAGVIKLRWRARIPSAGKKCFGNRASFAAVIKHRGLLGI